MAQILIIEDNPTNLQLMAYLLRAFGHTVIEAQNGRSGRSLAEQSPDLILCDIQLPDTDGYELARYFRSHPELRLIPLVAVTALAMVGDQERVRAAGFDGYLPKPIEPETFVRQVEAFLAPGHAPGNVPAGRSASGPEVEKLLTPPTGTTILAVDNEPVQLDLARRILEPFGYRVLTASGITEALSIAGRESCHLILSDVCMGDGTGHELLRRVREDSRLQDIPVVLITSTRLEAEDQDRALAMGAARYLTRPIEPAALLAEIRACLA